MVFKAAIIGCGNIAGGYDRKVPTEWSLTHAGAYYLCPETELVAVADPDTTKLKAFQKKWSIGRGYTSYEDMLDNETVDILSLCLPTQFHFEAFTSAADHDIKAVFCEKPLSNDLEQARQMKEMGIGKVVTVNYFRRFNPSLVELRRKVISGVYGKSVHATVRYTKGLFVNGSHLVDLARWLWGEPEKIDSMRIIGSNAKDPGVDFTLTFKNGLRVFFAHVHDVQYVFIDVDVLTAKERITIGQRGQRLTEYAIVQEPNYRYFEILEHVRETETEWRQCMLLAVQEIVSCLNNGGETSCTLADGYRTLEICHRVLDLIK